MNSKITKKWSSYKTVAISIHKKWLFSLAFLFVFLGLQAQTVTGTMTDEQGTPLIGATVLIKGTTIGTITDVDGNYRVSVPDDYSIIVFSGQGLKTQEIHVGTQSVIDIMMEYSASSDDSGNMQIGMGSVSKRQNTGNITRRGIELNGNK